MFHDVSNALGLVIWYGGILQPDLPIQSSLCNHCSLLYCLGLGAGKQFTGANKGMCYLRFSKGSQNYQWKKFQEWHEIWTVYREVVNAKHVTNSLWIEGLNDPYPLISGWCQSIALPGYTFKLFVFVFEFKPSFTRWQYKNRVQYTYHSLFTAVLVSGNKRPIPLNAPQLKGRR